MRLAGHLFYAAHVSEGRLQTSLEQNREADTGTTITCIVGRRVGVRQHVEYFVERACQESIAIVPRRRHRTCRNDP